MRKGAKGIILDGGRGARLLPLTRITNKHLLPIFDRPMIEYPLRVLLGSGIMDILIISGREHAGDFAEYLGSGAERGALFSYKVQEEAKGIAHALLLGEEFAAGNPIAVILGDNIFESAPRKELASFRKGAKIFLKNVGDPGRFGVPRLKDGKILEILEKPDKAPSPYAVTGLYQYDSEVFRIIKKLKPSQRGELEITDVNNAYLRAGKLKFGFIKGFWSDAGTFESMAKSTAWAAQKLKGRG